jgi:signal transduction histidine kinase
MAGKSTKIMAGALAASTETMIAALAHEIKNPLNAMKGASQYLHNKYIDTADIKEFTGIILAEIDRLDRYLNEFLSFSRGMKLKLRTVNVENFVTGMVMTVKHSFPCEIKIEMEYGMPDVEMDPEQIRQVLVNLLSNAKDAVSGDINRLPQVKIKAGIYKKNLHVSVIDNGSGMEAGVIKQIFNPFFTTKETGIGIGLTISKTIVEKHGGRIEVSSRPGRGTEFTIIIPAKQKVRDNA